MNYTAIYEDPFNDDSASEGGTRVTHEVKLRISSNIRVDEEVLKKELRRYLTERLKITNVEEDRIRIETA
jgi:hypothetical protein